MIKRFSFSKIVTLITLVLYYLPISILIIYSFNSSRYVSVWEGFSLKWYKTLLQDEALIKATITSLKVACSSATISTIIGTIAAFSLVKLKKLYGKTFLIGMLSVPFVVPEIIIGVSMLLFFIMLEKLIGWPEGRNIYTVMLAHTTIGIAYAYIIIQTRLLNFDVSLEEAAMNLGASPLKVFFLITLPIISKSLIAGWLLAFTLSFDDVIIATFTSGPDSTTLPVLIYSRIRIGLTPQINVLATIMIGTVTLIMLSIYIMNSRKQTNKE